MVMSANSAWMSAVVQPAVVDGTGSPRRGDSLVMSLSALSEGLAVAAHPGIVFKPGPSGRRAALAGGPDVWEVVSALRHVSGSEAKRVRELARQFGIDERQVVIALNYAAANREEIDARIRGNDLALDEAERVAGERERLLA